MTQNMYEINNKSNGVVRTYVRTSVTHKAEVRIDLLTFAQIVNNFALEPYSKLCSFHNLYTSHLKPLHPPIRALWGIAGTFTSYTLHFGSPVGPRKGGMRGFQMTGALFVICNVCQISMRFEEANCA